MVTDQVFDVVIVGAGSAGCVLANRLSADPSVRVLLLEAGPEDTDRYIHWPVGFFKMTAGPLIWGYDTVPSAAIVGKNAQRYLEWIGGGARG